jgi:hypothetical protein
VARLNIFVAFALGLNKQSGVQHSTQIVKVEFEIEFVVLRAADHGISPISKNLRAASASALARSFLTVICAWASGIESPIKSRTRSGIGGGAVWVLGSVFVGILVFTPLRLLSFRAAGRAA